MKRRQHGLFGEKLALKLAKLNGSNYRTWVFNMRLYLESMDLFGHANGSAKSPGTSVLEDSSRNFNWSAKKAWTYMYICLAIETEQQIHAGETTTARS